MAKNRVAVADDETKPKAVAKNKTDEPVSVEAADDNVADILGSDKPVDTPPAEADASETKPKGNRFIIPEEYVADHHKLLAYIQDHGVQSGQARGTLTDKERELHAKYVKAIKKVGVPGCRPVSKLHFACACRLWLAGYRPRGEGIDIGAMAII